MTDVTNERDALVNRQLPEMQMSDPSRPSVPTTTRMPESMSAQERALKRFAVEGNAVITGGCGNLALEAARALLDHGASGVGLFDLNPDQSTAAVDALRKQCPSARITTKKVNVAEAESVRTAFSETAAELGSIDILACFAGIVNCVHALDIKPEEWRRTVDINQTGTFLCAQAAARHMKDQGRGGSIVSIASISGHRVNFPQPQVAYNTAKSSLLHMARNLAAEWGGMGIRVNTISPGYMNTILNEGEGLQRAKEMWYSRNPMGRMGSPPELAGPLILLCSKYAGAYINGADLLVDGGQTVF